MAEVLKISTFNTDINGMGVTFCSSEMEFH